MRGWGAQNNVQEQCEGGVYKTPPPAWTPAPETECLEEGLAGLACASPVIPYSTVQEWVQTTPLPGFYPWVPDLITLLV